MTQSRVEIDRTLLSFVTQAVTTGSNDRKIHHNHPQTAQHPRTAVGNNGRARRCTRPGVSTAERGIGSRDGYTGCLTVEANRVAPRHRRETPGRREGPQSTTIVCRRAIRYGCGFSRNGGVATALGVPIASQTSPLAVRFADSHSQVENSETPGTVLADHLASEPRSAAFLADVPSGCDTSHNRPEHRSGTLYGRAVDRVVVVSRRRFTVSRLDRVADSIFRTRLRRHEPERAALVRTAGAGPSPKPLDSRAQGIRVAAVFV
jgi:hypothetical protein